ncbi:MAG TPA: hypothetical protein VH092_31395 [Urbifossiella sp.]|jgi:hypothetical protein|nr:hypothetical protein [Urbifossiella sp.]
MRTGAATAALALLLAIPARAGVGEPAGPKRTVLYGDAARAGQETRVSDRVENGVRIVQDRYPDGALSVTHFDPRRADSVFWTAER